MKMRARFVNLIVCLCLLATEAWYNAAVAEDSEGAARDPVVAAVQKVLPAVVNISTERLVARQFRDPFDEFWRQFFGQPRRPEMKGVQSLGSGVIVDEDGWIVTNWHVVRRATKIHVVLSDGAHYDAQYISGDEKNDLALLKIEPQNPLPYVEIAGESEPMLGETVIAVGNPFGLEHTVTRGVISAKNRSYDAGDVVFNDILQTDAAINPGNSGGPLINTRGQLLGINMAILSQAQGIGFAIPARRVGNLLATWFSPEKRARLWLGLRFAREDGEIVVVDVQPESPAAKAGFLAGDRITAVEGERVGDVLRLLRMLIHRKAGETIRFDVQRGGKPYKFAPTLAALPRLSVPEMMAKKFGLQIQPLSRDLAEALGISYVQGLLVADVERQSPAEQAGFRRGIVITHLAGEELQSMDRLAEILTDINPNDVVTMAVLISERRRNVTFQQTANVTLKSR